MGKSRVVGPPRALNLGQQFSASQPDYFLEFELPIQKSSLSLVPSKSNQAKYFRLGEFQGAFLLRKLQ